VDRDPLPPVAACCDAWRVGLLMKPTTHDNSSCKIRMYSLFGLRA
jgi:hypothetical protein